MKKFIILTALSISTAASAGEPFIGPVPVPEVPEFRPGDAIINSAEVDAENQLIRLTVSHAGGCAHHTYSLELNPACLETEPVQCSMQLLHFTMDDCEAYLTQNVVISFDEAGVSNSYYNGASISISDYAGLITNIQLPFASESGE